MPATLESIDYDLFDYKHLDEKPLDLETAIQEVKKLRSKGIPGTIYRVVPVDRGMGAFRIETVSAPKAEEEFRLRISQRWARLLSRYRLLTVK